MKYPLLLSAILKQTDSPVDRTILTELIKRMELFIHRINRRKWVIEEREILNGVYERLLPNDLFDYPNEEIQDVSCRSTDDFKRRKPFTKRRA